MLRYTIVLMAEQTLARCIDTNWAATMKGDWKQIDTGMLSVLDCQTTLTSTCSEFSPCRLNRSSGKLVLTLPRLCNTPPQVPQISSRMWAI